MVRYGNRRQTSRDLPRKLGRAMFDMLQKALQLFTGEPITQLSRTPKQRGPKRYTERDLLRMESAVGRQLFGSIPAGRQREFFCLDDHTWIWYESWTDPQTQEFKEQTIRYEMNPSGIIKIQEGQPYKVLEGQELKNMETAVRLYHERVMHDVYHRDPVTGEPLGF